MPTNKTTPMQESTIAMAFRDTGPGRKPGYHKGKPIADGKLALAMAKVPQAEIISEVEAEYSSEVWDGQPFNAHGGGRVISARDMSRLGLKAGGSAFLLKRNDNVIGVQVHAPNSPGNMSMNSENVQQCADDHCQSRINDEAMSRIIRAVSSELDNLDTTGP